MVKCKGAQAHLAQIDEVIASHDRAHAYLDTILQADDEPPDIPSPLPNTMDPVPDPVPSFSALSLTTSDSIDTPVSVINDDMFFELYLPSPLKSLTYSAISPLLFDLSLSPHVFASTSFPFNSLLFRLLIVVLFSLSLVGLFAFM